MIERTLFRAFEQLADTPSGVAKLRELILQLAVKGKLVAQNPAEELATNLITRIVDGWADSKTGRSRGQKTCRNWPTKPR